MSHTKHKVFWPISLAMLCLMVVLSACESDELSSTPQSKALKPLLVASATATPIPSPTPTYTPAPPTPTPRPGELWMIPSTPNTPFAVEMTEAEINQYLAEQTVEEEGATISDMHVTLTASEIICTVKAYHQQTGINAGVTIRGVPLVVDGKLYFKVNDITLDRSLQGFTRLVAQGVIEQAVKAYSTNQGVAVPLETLTLNEIKLMAGKIYVAGRTN